MNVGRPLTSKECRKEQSRPKEEELLWPGEFRDAKSKEAKSREAKPYS